MKYLFTFLFMISISCCYSQKDILTIYPDSLQKISFYIPTANFEITDSVELTVIQHFPAPFYCGTYATASITIGITGHKDTLRILGLCNMDTVPKGTKLFIIPQQPPGFAVIFPAQEEYAQQLYKTAWGNFDYRKP